MLLLNQQLPLGTLHERQIARQIHAEGRLILDEREHRHEEGVLRSLRDREVKLEVVLGPQLLDLDHLLQRFISRVDPRDVRFVGLGRGERRGASVTARNS